MTHDEAIIAARYALSRAEEQMAAALGGFVWLPGEAMTYDEAIIAARSALSRAEEQMVAALGGFFWLPCRRCGCHFGGHEKGGGSIYVGGGLAYITCPQCPEHTGQEILAREDAAQARRESAQEQKP